MSKIIVKDLAGPSSSSNKIYIASGSELDLANSTGTVNLAVNAGDITSGTLAAARLPSMNITASTGDVTITGALPSTITFAGAGVGAKIYSKDQSTSTYSLANGSWHTTGMGFYHTFSSTKTYVISGIIQRLYCDCNASEWTSVSYISICRVTSSSTIPASGSTTTPGSEIIAYTTGQSGPNTSTLNHDLWVGGVNLRYGPFTGTGSTDVIYANLKTYNTNVTTGIYGIRWIVEEFDVAPTTMS